MRYLLLVFALLFLGSGLVQGVLTFAWQDWMGLVGAQVQLIIGIVLLAIFIGKQKRHNQKALQIKMALARRQQ